MAWHGLSASPCPGPISYTESTFANELYRGVDVLDAYRVSYYRSHMLTANTPSGSDRER